MKPLDKFTNEIAQELSRRLFIRNSSVAAMGLLFAGNLIGCKKDKENEYSFYDTLDFTGPDKFIDLLASVNSLGDLPNEFKTNAENIFGEGNYIPFSADDTNIKNALFNFWDYAKSNYVLTDIERAELKNGDSNTFNIVMNRMTSIPSKIENEFSSEFQQKFKGSYFSKYLVTPKKIDTAYENFNYLNIALELESYHASYTIKTINELMNLSSIKSANLFTLIEILIGIAIIAIGITIIIPYIPGWICGWLK